jgi:hypothetical protein
MRLVIILILLNSCLYAQTESLKIIGEINTLLNEYSEMCEGNIDYYTVQYEALEKKVAIKICENESIVSFDLDEVDIQYVDEDNELNYSLCFRCLEYKKCISEQIKLDETHTELFETKITLIFPKIIQDLVNNFQQLKE